MAGTQADFNSIFQAIRADEQNESFTRQGIDPLYTASTSSRLVIIGQAPGRVAQETRIPWNDKSGDRLREWLGIDRETFYDPSAVALLPMDFYYPGKGKSGDLPPRKFIAEEYHPEILNLMPDISLTILIGKYSMDYYLKDRKKRNLTETVEAFREYLPDYFPIVHPSPLNFRWQAKNPWFEEEVVPALQKRVHEVL